MKLPPFPWRAGESRPLRPRSFPLLLAVLFGSAALLAAGCHRLLPTDTTPLDNAGMSYSSIQALKALDINNAEVAELVKAKQAGLSDEGCVQLVRIARVEKQPFHSADAVEQLLQAGVAEPTVLELARLNELGLWTGEAQAMRLAGLSDEIILGVARRRAAHQPVLSGASLAQLKNAGLSNATLLELVRRGVSDNQKDAIIRLRRRGWSDARILRQYPAARAAHSLDHGQSTR